MSRPRRFTKAEIMDAAKAAAETGLRAIMHPTGEIEFVAGQSKREKPSQSAEDALEGWINGGKAGGAA